MLLLISPVISCLVSLIRKIIFKGFFERFMDFRDDNITKIAYGRHVNLIRLVALYSPPTEKAREPILLTRFLFVNEDNGFSFSSLITLAEQLEVEQTLMPLCVREMINILDAVK